MSPAEYAGWQVFTRYEPIGEERMDLRFAQLCSVVVNLISKVTGGKTKTKAADFLLDFEANWAKVADTYPLVSEWDDLTEDEDEGAEQVEVPTQAARDLVEKLNLWTVALGGTPAQLPPEDATEGTGEADGDTRES